MDAKVRRFSFIRMRKKENIYFDGCERKKTLIMLDETKITLILTNAKEGEHLLVMMWKKENINFMDVKQRKH